jgi:acyl-CoA synthetase (NDP forming)
VAQRGVGAPAAGEEVLRPLGPLLGPASVAVIGASGRRPGIVRTALSGTARVWLVNPARDRVLGQRCYRSIAELPEIPDVAMVVVGHQAAEQAVAQAIAAGVPALVVPGLGAEAGAAGEVTARRIAALAAEAAIPIVGANCMGYARPAGTSLWLGTLPERLVAGHVAVLSQSGSVAEALLASGFRPGLQVVVSSGSELSRDAADFLAAFAADEGTRAIGLFLETVRRPAAFAAALRACAEAAKPVVCLKVGRSAPAAAVALTHTGAVVGSARSFSAFLDAYGVIEVTDVPELVETLEVLGRARRPQGLRVAAVSESGGEAALLADHAEAAGLRMELLPQATMRALRDEFPNFLDPHNPLDAWAVDAPERVFPRSFELLRDTGSYDILLAEVELTRFRSPEDNAWCAGIVRALASATAGTALFPAVVSTNCVDPPDAIAQFARDADVALLRGTRAAARALAAVARWEPRHPPGPPPFLPARAPDPLRPGLLTESESAALLSRYGVRFAPFRRAHSGGEAARAAEELGFPVVVKADGVAHKSRVGGVALGICTAGQAAAAAERLGGTVLVARQVPAGLEVICGIQRDPMFGSVIAIGLGGAVAEALGPSAAALAPLGTAAAAGLVDTLPGIGAESFARARDELVRVLVALSCLVMDHPEVEAVDINPVVAGRGGATAVDALVAVRHPEPPPPHTPEEENCRDPGRLRAKGLFRLADPQPAGQAERPQRGPRYRVAGSAPACQP